MHPVRIQPDKRIFVAVWYIGEAPQVVSDFAVWVSNGFLNIASIIPLIRLFCSGFVSQSQFSGVAENPRQAWSRRQGAMTGVHMW